MTPAPAAPSSAVVGAFLSDVRLTYSDLLEIKVWFDRLAGGEIISCETALTHSIHLPRSSAPASAAELAGIWAEYQQAISDGGLCLQWLVDFCEAGGGLIDAATFWDRRGLSAAALSHVEHVTQALEAMQ